MAVWEGISARPKVDCGFSATSLGGVLLLARNQDALASPKTRAGKAQRQDRGPHLGAGLYNTAA